MNLLYPVKHRIVYSQYAKRKKQKPMDIVADELYQLPANAPDYQNNSYFFGGHSLDREESLMMRLGLRNRPTNEIFVFYRNKDMFLVTEGDEYPADNLPLKCRCIEPCKTWEASFDGTLVDKATGEKHHVVFCVTFEARREIYDFYYSLQNPYAIRAVANAKWTKEFQEYNAKNDQRHYEQSGWMNGILSIDGVERPIHLPAGRDHSLGRRVWKEMREHIWLFAFRENGEIFNYSLVDYPELIDIESGYTDLNRDRLVSLKKAKIVNYQYNNGLGSDDLDIEITLEDGEKLDVKSRRAAYHETHYDGGDFYFQEGIGTIYVNGVPFFGCVEYGFNRDPDLWLHWHEAKKD